MLRNATLGDLAVMLKEQHAKKLDVIAPAAKLRSKNGVFIVEDAHQEISMDGVTSRDVHLAPTAMFDEGLSEKLGIPLAYVRRMRATNIDLYDENVNGWLHQDSEARSFLVRSFTGDGHGIARAFLSDSYRFIDHLDALTAALDGIAKSGMEVEITKCDLTERRMYVKVNAPSVLEYAPDLLKGYRSPFTGETGDSNPGISAGFVIQNSETGDGAFTIVPSMTVLVCTNGLTRTKDAVRAVHLGGKLDEGIVRWSEETQAKTLELVTLKAADAVKTFLDVDYMKAAIAQMTEDAGKPLTGPLDKTVRAVGKKLNFADDTIDGVLDHFMRGGQFTAGGVMQAVTSFAQTVPDADRAWAIEEAGMRALEVAAAI